MMMSNLPCDLVEEILSRVPLTYLRAVRFTCKTWNDITKDRSFTDKHIGRVSTSEEREFMMFTGCRVYLFGYNLHGEHNNVDLSIKSKGKLRSMGDSHKILYGSQVFQCNGSLLCLSGEGYVPTRLVVWNPNPYSGKPKLIKPRDKYNHCDRMFLGYDQSCGSHKILRLFDYCNVEIYNMRSNSWKVLNVTRESAPTVAFITSGGYGSMNEHSFMTSGVSLKGNTYWYAKDKESEHCYVFCYDFTRERFGPLLHTPFGGDYEYTPFGEADAYISVVKEKQLAVLLFDTWKIEIWVTNQIEPDAVSWINFLKVYIKPDFHYKDFLIDEKKKVAVLFGKDYKKRFNVAYIIGDNGYFRRVDFGESLYARPRCFNPQFYASRRVNQIRNNKEKGSKI